MLVYKITNTLDSKVYIGKTVRDFSIRKREHLHAVELNKSKVPLYQSIRKYGTDNFKFEVICQYFCITIDELNEYEKYYIKLYKSTDRKYGYNITSGGDGFEPMFGKDNPFFGKHHTEKNKKERSDYIINNKIYSREKNPAWKGGRFKHQKDGYIYIRDMEHPFSNKSNYIYEHRLIMEKHIGRYVTTDEVVAHINGIPDDNRLENLELISREDFNRRRQQGSVRSNETKLKMSLSSTGKKKSKEHCENISKAKKGKTHKGIIHTQETKDLLKEKAKQRYSDPNYINPNKGKIKLDLLGKKFGSLTVIRFSRIDYKSITHWICKCDCGKEVEKRRGNLISGNSHRCSRSCEVNIKQNEGK